MAVECTPPPLTGIRVDTADTLLLKADELGRIELTRRDGVPVIRRDVRAARWWA